MSPYGWRNPFLRLPPPPPREAPEAAQTGALRLEAPPQEPALLEGAPFEAVLPEWRALLDV
ncbi:hypothetical protein N5079_13725 [Planotetraspora sp. A-T 1434]|uniref:hypothetical protein n=1 Tax=Planotetraspora sp. A-T 1434 TaxID=2979219 RepID=UPI0021BEF8FC|nr:hypothetical protein [Planotetraspora sp. A-T 1434]MCT9931277.1 hypothetical protein [Planotetraspora sp. A-T 1434]